MILLDTDICVEILRGNRAVAKKRDQFPGDVAVSFMTVAELYYGAEHSKRPVENHLLAEAFLHTLPILEPGNQTLKRFGSLKAELKRKHQLLPDADIFIAATALEQAEALITGNVKHFQRIEGLRLEDWLR